MDSPHKRLEVDVDKVVELRFNEGLSQRELAARASVSNQSVAKLEQGGNLRPATLKKIADVLGVKVTDLMKERRS
jgi:transcriptional regulator with XRE-family HTH domain